MLAVTRHVFGYDFFISYSHGDAKAYAIQLHEVLVGLGYRVFIDDKELHAGQELTPAITAALRRSSALIAIVSPGAVEQSTWVEKEVRLFSETMRTVIAISLRSDLAYYATSSILLELLGERLRVTEAAAGDTVQPSQQTVSQLAKALKGPRIERRRTYALMGTSLVFAALAALSIWFGIGEQASRMRAESEAIAARKETASRYAVEAKAALGSRPEEAMELARRAVDVFRDAGDPLVAPAVSALQEVVQSVAGHSLGQAAATLMPDGSALLVVQDGGELLRIEEPSKFGLTQRSTARLPSDLGNEIDSFFLVEGEAFVLARADSDEFYLDLSIIRVSDWQRVHRIKGEFWDTEIRACYEDGKIAVVREDRIELLDTRHPNEVRLALPVNEFDSFVQFSADCRWLLATNDGVLLIANTTTKEVKRFALPEYPPIDAAVTGDVVLILDATSGLWRLTDSGSVGVGNVFELHDDLVTARGVPFGPNELSGRIEIADDQSTVLASYSILIEDDVDVQGIGMAGIFSLSNEFAPWSVRQNNPEMFGELSESSSSSFNNEQLSSNEFVAKDLSSLGVSYAQFLSEPAWVATLGFDGDMLVHSDVHQRIRLAENVSSFTTSPDQRLIVTGHMNGDIKFWELDYMESGDSEPLFVWRGHDAAVVDIHLDESSSLLISHDERGYARYWHQSDPRLGADTQTLSSPDGRFLVTVDLYGNHHIWDLQAEDPFAFPLTLDPLPTREIAFTSSHAVTLHLDSTPGSARLRLWEFNDSAPFVLSSSFELSSEPWIELAQEAYSEHPMMVPGSAWMELLTHGDQIWLVAGNRTIFSDPLRGVVLLDNATDRITLANSAVMPREYPRVVTNYAGSSMATIDESNAVVLWQLEGGRDGPVPTPIEWAGRIDQLRYSPDNAWLLLGAGARFKLVQLATSNQFELDLAVDQIEFVGGTSRLISEHEGTLTIHEILSGQSQALTIEPAVTVRESRLSRRGTDALIVDTDERLWWVLIPSGGSVARAVLLPSPAEPIDEPWTAFEAGATALTASLNSGGLVIWYRDDSGALSEPVVIPEPHPGMRRNHTITSSADNDWVMVRGWAGYRARPLSLGKLTSAASSGRSRHAQPRPGAD